MCGVEVVKGFSSVGSTWTDTRRWSGGQTRSRGNGVRAQNGARGGGGSAWFTPPEVSDGCRIRPYRAGQRAKDARGGVTSVVVAIDFDVFTRVRASPVVDPEIIQGGDRG